MDWSKWQQWQVNDGLDINAVVCPSSCICLHLLLEYSAKGYSKTDREIDIWTTLNYFEKLIGFKLWMKSRFILFKPINPFLAEK